MPASARVHLDEHCPNSLAEGLRRQGFDVTTTREAGLLGADDERQLEYANSNGRAIVTCDEDYLRLHASGSLHQGIIYCKMGRRTIGEMIRGIVLIFEVYGQEEMIGKVEHL
jgi:predicted nuclease of predicted toxin-antitoxin system